MEDNYQNETLRRTSISAIKSSLQVSVVAGHDDLTYKRGATKLTTLANKCFHYDCSCFILKIMYAKVVNVINANSKNMQQAPKVRAEIS